MATTTNYSWTTPDDTNYVKDGASAIRTLGSAIDSTLKTQIDAQIPDSLLTTKGDLIAATGASTPARLGVGTNGQVLVADSTASTGVAWASSGASVALTPSVTGTYLKRQHTATCGSVLLTATNTTYYFPVYIGSGTFDRITIISGDSGTGSFPLRLGVYNSSSTTGLPSTVLFDAGTVTVSALSTVYEITINQTISRGLYYFAFNAQGTMGTLQMFTGGFSQPLNASSSYAAAFSQTASSNILGYSQSSVTGAFATAGTLTAETTASRFALMGMRYA
jgi:hypothetical protein